MEVISNIPEYEGIGIYAIVDENGKMYIGQAINVKKRLLWHSKNIPLNGSSSKLYQAYQDGHTFTAEVLEEIDYGVTKFFLAQREEYYIRKYNTFRSGYNILPTSLDYYRKDNPKEYLRDSWFTILKDPHLSKWQADNCERISLVVPKGKKDEYKRHATGRGETLNGFIKRAIDETIERDGSGNNAAVE